MALALRIAYALGYVHRDVSEPNIILFRRSVDGARHGDLIDWKLASEVCEGQPREARDYCRMVSFHYSPRRHNIIITLSSFATGNDCIHVCPVVDRNIHEAFPTQHSG